MRPAATGEPVSHTDDAGRELRALGRKPLAHHGKGKSKLKFEGPSETATPPRQIDFAALLARPIVPVEMPAAATALLAEQHIELEPGDAERLGAFLAMLNAANEVVNLTSVREPAEAWMRHIGDALCLLPVIATLADGLAESPRQEPAPEFSPAGQFGPSVTTIIDVGTGAGLPGIPLAIAMPTAHVTLLESNAKKAAFLTAVTSQMGLSNTYPLQARAEQIGQDFRTWREAFDIGLARAVGELAVLVELVAPLVRVGGYVLAVKGARADEEVHRARRAMDKLGLELVETIKTPTSSVIVMTKVKKTPRLFPRRDGEPARVPIGITRDETKAAIAGKPGVRTGEEPKPAAKKRVSTRTGSKFGPKAAPRGSSRGNVRTSKRGGRSDSGGGESGRRDSGARPSR